MSVATGVVRALADPGGAAGLLPARLRAALLRATLALQLRGIPLDELLDVLAGRATPQAVARRRRPPGARIAGPEVTVRGLRRLPITCLTRSLAGYAALRAAGQAPRFVIGVRREADEVLAHAWLEHAGRPVGEVGDPHERFTVAYVHPPRCPPTSLPEEDRMTTPGTNPDVLLTTLPDGTGVLLDLRTKFYFTLNRSGVVAWQALAGGVAADPEALVDLLVASFADVDRARAREDVQLLLRDLQAEGLLAAGG